LPDIFDYASFGKPIIIDNVVYVPSVGGGIWALNASNGKILWDTGNTGGGGLTIDKGIVYTSVYGYAYNASTGALLGNTPGTQNGVLAVYNGYFYSLNDAGKLVCMSATSGKEIWVSDVVLYYRYPAMDSGLVYFCTYDGIVALNANTGGHVWQSTLDGQVDNSPAVSSGRLFASTDHYVYCLNSSTGKVIWNYTTEEIFVDPSVFDGYLYINSRNGNLYALNASTGEKIWNYSTCVPVPDDRYCKAFSSPAIANGAVYVYSSDGNLYAFNAYSGVKLWNLTLENPPPRDFVLTSFDASPVIANGKIFVTTFDHLFALQSKPVTDNNSPTPTLLPTTSYDSLLLPFLVLLGIILFVCLIILFARAKYRRPKPENAKS
jgi:outer membrane protein assembly factor BamB